MATFQNGRGLVEAQRKRFEQRQQAVINAQRQAVNETARYAQTLLHGTPAQPQTGRGKRLYRAAHSLRGGRPFPIGYRTGNLARSMQMVYQQTNNDASGFLTFTDPAARFVLSPEGTRNMAGTPFWNKVNTFYVQRFRQLAGQAQERAGK